MFSARHEGYVLDSVCLLAPLSPRQGKHFIVVYEVTRQHVIVADPAKGQRKLSQADFKAGWTGYALLLQPTALLKEASEVGQPFWQFFELVKPHWLVLLEVLFASILVLTFPVKS